MAEEGASKAARIPVSLCHVRIAIRAIMGEIALVLAKVALSPERSPWRQR
jgi:hypothetical protein